MGYNFGADGSLTSGTDTHYLGISISEVYSDPEGENPLPVELYDVCYLVVFNKLWSMYGDRENVSEESRIFLIKETTYNMLEHFEGTLTVSL